MARVLRQSKILEIIAQKAIETQEELAGELIRLKYKVTQATISRDIKELGLIKILDGSKYRYAAMGSDRQKLSAKMISLFRESVMSIQSAKNLIVVKTLSGSANAAGMAIDKMGCKGILGCVAGDDTLLIVCISDEAVEGVVQQLNAFMD